MPCSCTAAYPCFLVVGLLPSLVHVYPIKPSACRQQLPARNSPQLACFAARLSSLSCLSCFGVVAAPCWLVCFIMPASSFRLLSVLHHLMDDVLMKLVLAWPPGHSVCICFGNANGTPAWQFMSAYHICIRKWMMRHNSAAVGVRR